MATSLVQSMPENCFTIEINCCNGASKSGRECECTDVTTTQIASFDINVLINYIYLLFSKFVLTFYIQESVFNHDKLIFILL